MYHEAYNKAKRRYKQELKDSGVVNPRLSIVDFIKINALIWSNWWTPNDRRAAFRQVGICQGKVAAELVNREKFYMPPPPPTPTAPMSLVAESPEGVAKGSTEYWKVKYERQVAITERLAKTEVGPKEAGILEVTVQQKRKPVSSMRITDGHGSSELTGLLEKIQSKKATAAAADATKSATAADRAAKKAESDAAAAAELAKWRYCQPVCACQSAPAPPARPLPCPMAGWRLCPFCDTLKKRQCGAKACKEAAEAACGAGSLREGETQEEPESESEEPGSGQVSESERE